MEIRLKTALVVGAGVVGLATAYHLSAAGLAVTVVDRDPTGDKASFGNAAGIAVTEMMPASVPGLAWKIPGWLLDPLGPLAVRPSRALRLLPWLWRFSRAGRPVEVARIGRALAALNHRVYDDLLPMLEATGLSAELHRNGALSVYETQAGFVGDAAEWAFKQSHGIDVEMLSGDQAREMEPALGPIVTQAVFTPQWSHISDPKNLVDRLRAWLETTQNVRIIKHDVKSLAVENDNPSLILADGGMLSADIIVVAAGAWSGPLAQSIGDRAVMESERGYNSTLPTPGVALTREIIFAERKFVATPLRIGLRIGGAAEFGGLDATANFKRSDTLVRLASRYLPGLDPTGGKPWAGHRPTTPDSLPVIGPSPRCHRVYYAFGHGHLGLTQAATTGRIIANLVAGRPAGIDIAPYAITRFS